MNTNQTSSPLIGLLDTFIGGNKTNTAPAPKPAAAGTSSTGLIIGLVAGAVALVVVLMVAMRK